MFSAQIAKIHIHSAHRIELMEALIKHSTEIANLAPLTNDQWIELTTPYGVIDTNWFAKHKGHNLIPIDEYGCDINGEKVK